MTRAERAADYPNKPVYVLGMSEQSGIRGEYTPDYLNREFLKGAGDQIWREDRPGPGGHRRALHPEPDRGLGAADAQVVRAGRRGGPVAGRGHARPGGDLPVNTNGGQLSESYMWGWLHLPVIWGSFSATFLPVGVR